MQKKDFKKIKLPDKPGVYFFLGSPKHDGGGKKGKQILYIGKATSLRDRVKSYFSKDLISTRGPLILDMVFQSDNIHFQVTDSVVEALILEANLIKKYQPKYNTKEKDNKSFNYVVITKDKLNPSQPPLIRGGAEFKSPHDKGDLGGLPKVLIIRGRNLNKKDYQSVFGPFTNGSQLKEAMKIIRRIFPYIDEQSSKKNNKEFYKQLGLIPEVFPPLLTKEGNEGRFLIKRPLPNPPLSKGRENKEYKNNIKNLKLFFQGKKKSILINMKKEMLFFAKKKEFEKAGEMKKRIFALNHINDVALIKESLNPSQPPLVRGGAEFKSPHDKGDLGGYARIEAYDVAHLFGKNMVGVMTVMEGGELAKNEYKKFIVRTQDKSNDTGALLEILSRRMRHTEWGLPDIIVMDGSIAQINIAKSVLNRYQFKIPVVSVVKNDKHKAKAIMGDEKIIKKYKKEILLINNEAHRFAITFHKKRRNKNFLIYEVPYNNSI